MDAVVIYAIYVLNVSIRSSVIELYMFGRMDLSFSCKGELLPYGCVNLDACHGAGVLIQQTNRIDDYFSWFCGSAALGLVYNHLTVNSFYSFE